MSSSTIESALLEATGVKPQKKNEDRQKYLIRLMMGVSKLPDEKWEDLEAVEGAQDWYNNASDADNEEKELPDFADVEEEPEEEEEEAPPAKASKKQAKKPAKKPARKVAKAPARKVAKAPAKKAAPSKKKISARRELKLMVVKQPQITTDEIIARLEKKGYTPPSRITVTTTRSETRDTMRVIKASGIDLDKTEV